MTFADDAWELPPPELILPDEVVHVWRVPLEQPLERIKLLRRLLSPDEEARAERFQFEQDRRRFIVARGALRTILGGYLGMAAAYLRFRYGPQGKPYLSEEINPRGLQFNLAHSNELAVFGVTYGREVGIDVEYVKPMKDFEEIAARFFTASENELIQKLPQDRQLEGFFRCWTRKEAYAKARGDGLGQALEPEAHERDGHKPGEERIHWSLETLTAGAGYVGALVVQGSGWHVRYWEFIAKD